MDKVKAICRAVKLKKKDRARGEGDDRGWDCWMASLTQ